MGNENILIFFLAIVDIYPFLHTSSRYISLLDFWLKPSNVLQTEIDLGCNH